MIESADPSADEDSVAFVFDDVLDIVTKVEFSDCLAQLFRLEIGQWIAVSELLTLHGKSVDWSVETMWAAWVPYPEPMSNYRIVLFFEEGMHATHSATCRVPN